MKNFFKWLLRLFLLLTTVYTVVAALLLHGVNAYHTDTEIGKVLAIGGQYTFAAAVILWGVTLFILRRRAVLRKKAAAAGAAQMAAQTAAGTTSLPLDAKTPPIAPRGPVKAAAPAVQQEPAAEKTPVLDSAQEPTPVLPGQESSAGRTAVLQPTPVLPQMDTPAERTELLEPLAPAAQEVLEPEDGKGQEEARKQQAENIYFCPRCGNRIRAGAKFCTKCGQKLEGIV